MISTYDHGDDSDALIENLVFASHMISPIQICDYGDFVDGECLTLTTAATETTTTTAAQDIGAITVLIKMYIL